MRIAVATDDGETVSEHFGRAPYYVVIAVENGKVIGREQLDKPAHHYGHGEHQHEDEPGGTHAGHSHDDMLAPIEGCEVLLARGMGYPAYRSLQSAGIRPIITDVRQIDEAVRQYLSGGLTDHTERLH